MATLLAASVGALALTGCSDDSSHGPSGGSSPTTTPPMLAAAVAAHSDLRVVAAAQLTDEERVRGGDLGVEVALDRPEGDNAHVRLRVSKVDRQPDEPDAQTCRTFRCEDLSTDGTDGQDGVEATLVVENGAPEEDPGVVYGYARWGDRTVLAYGYGPFVGRRGLSPEAKALRDTIAGLLTDPAIGFTTSQAYSEAAADVCDGPWLDWYGQGNGYPEPEDNPDWC